MRESSDTTNEEPFLQRWSRRKQQSAKREERALEAQEGVETAAEPAEPPPGEEEMPPLESLDEHSDYSLFLSPRVSETLRRMALRKLFHSPAFNVRDALDDYDEDFRDLAALGTLIPEELKRHLGEKAEKIVGSRPTEPAAPAAAERAQERKEETADTEEDEELG